MARGTLQNMAVPRSKNKPPRHRHDVALNIPGAEVRMPSLPALRVGWRVASGLLVILMSLSLYILLYTPAFQVEVLEVEGLQRLTLEEVNSVLNVSGESIVKIDPEELHAELQAAFPELSSIQVRVFLPARVKVDVLERTPLISWVQSNSNGNSEEKWVDQEGFAFSPRGEVGSLIRVETNVDISTDAAIEAEGLAQAKASNLSNQTKVDLTAIKPTPMLSTEMVKTLQNMATYVPAGTPILFSAEHGFGWQDPKGWQVYLGKNLKDISQKLVIYQKLEESLAEQGIEPSLISVEFLHAPYYRTEQ